MTEVEARFGWNRHRKRFVELLGHFLLPEIRPRFAQAFFVNGSFVTDKEEPGDVDVVLDMRAAHDDQKWQALVLMRDRQEQFLTQYGVHFGSTFPAKTTSWISLGTWATKQPDSKGWIRAIAREY